MSKEPTEEDMVNLIRIAAEWGVLGMHIPIINWIGLTKIMFGEDVLIEVEEVYVPYSMSYKLNISHDQLVKLYLKAKPLVEAKKRSAAQEKELKEEERKQRIDAFIN